MKRILNSAFLLILSVFVCDAQTWYKANNPFGGNVIEMHQTEGGALLCGTTRGLYRSTDNGNNWQSISGMYENFATQGVNSTPSGMYISLFGPYLRRSYDEGQTWETIPAQNWTSHNIIVVNDNGQIFLNTNNSVWRSSDEGDNWTQLTVDTNVPSLLTLEISPDGELFAGTYSSTIYRSSDNGDTWTELFTLNNNRDVRTFGFDGDSIIYAGNLFSGMYKSMDNGDNWSLLPALPGSKGTMDIEVNTSGEVLVATFEDGVLKSTDGGMTWQDLTSNLIDPSVKKIFLNSQGDLFVGTEAAGVQKHDGSSWIPTNQGISAIYIERFIAIDSVLYACTSAGVFISEDRGQSWQQSIQGMNDTEINALAKAPNGDLYAGGEMLYYSTDGIVWNDISQGFPGSEVYATDILVEPNGRVIVATDEYGIRFTDNQGQSWTNANSGLEDVSMAFLRKSQNGDLFTADGYNLYRSNDLFGSWVKINTGMGDPDDVDITEFTAGTGALFAITYSDGLFKSVDNGNNWSLANVEDFNNVAVNGNEVYGSSARLATGGVYFSDDNGATWSNIGNGLPNIQVEEVNYTQDLGLFANVRDFGLYTLDFSVVGLDELGFEKGQLTCFPNPFSESTTLRLALEENAEVSFTVFTLQGQVVERSTHLNLAKGTHDLRVGKGLAPGMYFVRVVRGNSQGTIRLVKTN